MTEHYYQVGIHGAPTPETAPHGYMHRLYGADWVAGYRPENRQVWANATEWYPLPAPPAEQAPPPAPVARWAYCRDYDNVSALRLSAHPPITDHHEAARYRDALNALDRDGVAWGPGRPMSELPDDGLVLLLDDGGAFCVLPIETVRAWSVFVCWWPLPGAAQ